MGALLNHSCEGNCIMYYDEITHTQQVKTITFIGKVCVYVPHLNPRSEWTVDGCRMLMIHAHLTYFLPLSLSRVMSCAILSSTKPAPVPHDRPAWPDTISNARVRSAPTLPPWTSCSRAFAPSPSRRQQRWTNGSPKPQRVCREGQGGYVFVQCILSLGSFLISQ